MQVFETDIIRGELHFRDEVNLGQNHMHDGEIPSLLATPRCSLLTAYPSLVTVFTYLSNILTPEPRLLTSHQDAMRAELPIHRKLIECL